MSNLETPPKRGPNVPPGCILVNEKWRGSNFERELAVVGKGLYCDGLGPIDFYPSELCPVVYISESDLIGLSYERKLKQVLQIPRQHGAIIAVRNNFTLKHFSELQDQCYTLKLTLIPIGSMSELPQMLLQLAYVECKSPSNPFKHKQKPSDDLAALQLKLFRLIPEVGEKKAKLLLEKFGHPQGIASVPKEMLIAKLTPIVGEKSAQNIFNFYYEKNRLK
ncbi:Fanconi anemia core complex-associated protein 24-like [Periplaneta americana]|uniref:Fanconi anemia core complex-associated protein 24-like n=1 Tax=Periplaneta americana TaxID=6978 RepID=UPI0037E78793